MIALAAIAAYARTLRGDWLWDDDQDVTQNEALRSAEGLRRIWTAPPGVNYFPLTETVEWVEWRLWRDRPLGYRCVNLGLQVLAALLVWAAAERVRVQRAWLGGLLFAVHPLAVESVAWVSELKNTLSLVLALLAFCAWLDFTDGPRRRAWPALVWFVAALLAKSTVVGLPVVLAMVRWRRELIAFFAAALASGFVAIWFEHTRAIGSLGGPAESLVTRIEAAGLAIWYYLGKCLMPVGQSPIYPRWEMGPLAWVGPAGMLVALGFLWWRARPAFKYAAAFVVMAAPTLGVIAMAYQRLSWVADHFAYAALPVAAIGVVALFERVEEKTRRGRRVYGARVDSRSQVDSRPRVESPSGVKSRAGVPSNARVESPSGVESRLRVDATPSSRFARLPGSPTPATIVLLAMAACEWCATFVYAKNFTSPEALWTRTLAINPGAWSAQNDLGYIQYIQNRLPEATARFAEAVRLNPSYPEARNNLGVALASAGRFVEAEAQYRRALALRPAYASAECNLGNAYLQTGRLAEAAGAYRAALAANPTFPEAHYNLGLALRALGRQAQARAEFEASGLKAPPN